MMKGTNTIIGIDLGTSTTEAAVFRDGKPVMILNFDGNAVTPSVVGTDESGNFMIGSKARAQLLLEPEKTAIEIKRKMGTGETISLGGKPYTPVELSTMILSYVKRYASTWLGEEIDRAVISVPAYFNDIQRQATVQAGKAAGLTVERIINEPTAAAMSYGMEHMEEDSHILVYDLGGGTFDVTLLEMFDGVLEVKASSGDNHLGGKDFDEKLVVWLAERFYDRYEIQLQSDVYAMVKLKEEAERCKIALSCQEAYDIKLPLIAQKDGKPLALEETVTAAQFEELIGDMILRTHRPIDVVLGDSGLSKSDIDLILLVGGSTRVPLVRKDIERFMGMEPASLVDPDYAVAEGAAVQAGIISGVIKAEDSLIMTDVNPFTLGIRVSDGFDTNCMSVIIPRNVTIPVTRKETYTTSADGQRSADIEIYQGEFHTATRNNFLGKFNIGGIPPKPAGEGKIDVSFSYNQNGMLAVTAMIPDTGREASIEVDLMEAKEEARIDVSGWKNAKGAGAYRTVIRRAEKLLLQPELKAELSDWEELDEMVYLLKRAILQDNDEAEELEDEILAFLEVY